jgi:hypothetical protein
MVTTAPPRPFDQYGAFKSLFEPTDGQVPGYLALLNLPATASSAVRQLRDAVNRSGADLERNVRALLSDETGWRAQLVGAAALVAQPANVGCIDTLWDALDHWCWTSPQLAAAASRIDPQFRAKARLRLENRCYVLPLRRMMDREKMAKNEGRTDPKLMASLVALCGKPHEAWLRELIEQEDFARLLTEDRDDGDEFAVGWLRRLDELLLGAAEA